MTEEQRKAVEKAKQCPPQHSPGRVPIARVEEVPVCHWCFERLREYWGSGASSEEDS